MKMPLATLGTVQAELSTADLLRVCRDLAWSEMATMPGLKLQLGPRLSSAQRCAPLDWSPAGLALDSLARMQLATAAAVWCNAGDAGFEDLFLAKRNVADWAEVMQRARAAGASGFTFSTSGSTGKRQHIRHPDATLMAEAAAWAQVLETFALPVSRIVTLVPCHHIYGFVWGLLLPKVLDVPVLDACHDALPELRAGDLLVAVPDQWQWLAGLQNWPQDRQQVAPNDLVRAKPDGVCGISSAAPMPGAVHCQLVTARAPAQPMLARLLQIYGSTQTAGVAWRDNPERPYTLAPGRIRSACDGIALRLPDGTHAQLALQDELRWTGPCDFELLRRADNCVQVGGHNVSTVWVTEQLQAHPAVQDASVRLDAAAAPPRLKAFVVLKTPDDVSQQSSLEEWLTHNLPWYANFSTIRYGAELPRNALGKHSDWPA